ncbi:hypothetical protein WA026_005923 [Henosepilachna vigintioctopunctata]|uniref:Uncharacterized protein n=1 Tax=Henosepilachna vigintioctopunctata TaxID=420089 RepID=A0AAW1U2I3_9CUCU
MLLSLRGNAFALVRSSHIHPITDYGVGPSNSQIARVGTVAKDRRRDKLSVQEVHRHRQIYGAKHRSENLILNVLPARIKFKLHNDNLTDIHNGLYDGRTTYTVLRSEGGASIWVCGATARPDPASNHQDDLFVVIARAHRDLAKSMAAAQHGGVRHYR